MSESFGAPARRKDPLLPTSTMPSGTYFAPILFLPDGVAIGTLLPKLSARELSIFSACCRHFRKWAANDNLWRLLVQSCASFALLPASTPSFVAAHGWREVYARCAPALSSTGYVEMPLATAPHKSAVLTPQRSRSRRQMSVSAVGGGLVSAMSNLMRPLSARGSSTKELVHVLLVHNSDEEAPSAIFRQMEALGRCFTSWADGAPPSGGSWLGEARCVYRTRPAEDFAVDEIEFEVQPPRASADARRPLRVHLTSVRLDDHTTDEACRHVGEYVARSHALIYEAAVLTTAAVARSRRSYYRTLLDPCFRPSAEAPDPRGVWPVLILSWAAAAGSTPPDCCCPADVAAAFHLASEGGRGADHAQSTEGPPWLQMTDGMVRKLVGAHGSQAPHGSRRVWRVQGCGSGAVGDASMARGLGDGLQWLSSALQAAQQQPSSSEGRTHAGSRAANGTGASSPKETYVSGTEAGMYNSSI